MPLKPVCFRGRPWLNSTNQFISILSCDSKTYFLGASGEDAITNNAEGACKARSCDSLCVIGRNPEDGSGKVTEERN